MNIDKIIEQWEEMHYSLLNEYSKGNANNEVMQMHRSQMKNMVDFINQLKELKNSFIPDVTDCFIPDVSSSFIPGISTSDYELAYTKASKFMNSSDEKLQKIINKLTEEEWETLRDRFADFHVAVSNHLI
jgi:hypothetical protein